MNATCHGTSWFWDIFLKKAKVRVQRTSTESEQDGLDIVFFFLNIVVYYSHVQLYPITSVEIK